MIHLTPTPSVLSAYGGVSQASLVEHESKKSNPGRMPRFDTQMITPSSHMRLCC